MAEVSLTVRLQILRRSPELIQERPRSDAGETSSGNSLVQPGQRIAALARPQHAPAL
jgi:hypothetical protein